MGDRRRLAVAVVAAALAAGAAATPAPAQAPNDEHWGWQWGPRMVRAPEAWSVSRGDGQTIAIVDTGVDLDHPDLAGQIAGGATFVCGDAPAPCGDGDWQSGSDAGQGNNHGTHVAGIAAAATGNGVGIAGVAPGARLLAVKVLDSRGDAPRIAAIAEGIRWAADNGADVINMSLGYSPESSLVHELPRLTGQLHVLHAAVRDARDAGAVVVASAGNDHLWPLCGSPASADGALCVIAVDAAERPAAYSNGGVKRGLDAVAAPGGMYYGSCTDDTISTVPRVGVFSRTFCQRVFRLADYDFFAGTSMAAPHVAGVAALLTAQGRTDDEVVDVLERTARTPLTGERGAYTSVYGYGIVDAAAALAAPRVATREGSR